MATPEQRSVWESTTSFHPSDLLSQQKLKSEYSGCPVGPGKHNVGFWFLWGLTSWSSQSKIGKNEIKIEELSTKEYLITCSQNNIIIGFILMILIRPAFWWPRNHKERMSEQLSGDVDIWAPLSSCIHWHSDSWNISIVPPIPRGWCSHQPTL